MTPTDQRSPADDAVEEDRTNARGEPVARASFNRSPTNDPGNRGSATEADAGELPHDDGLQPGGAVDGGNAGLRQAIDLDDDEIYSGRGNQARTGGTADADGGDSGRLGPPSEQLSDSNAPREKNLP